MEQTIYNKQYELEHRSWANYKRNDHPKGSEPTADTLYAISAPMRTEQPGRHLTHSLELRHNLQVHHEPISE